jgi:hypothetical protein
MYNTRKLLKSMTVLKTGNEMVKQQGMIKMNRDKLVSYASLTLRQLCLFTTKRATQTAETTTSLKFTIPVKHRTSLNPSHLTMNDSYYEKNFTPIIIVSVYLGAKHRSASGNDEFCAWKNY